MSKKQWMVLLMLFLTYLLLGASIFYHIESRLEMERVEKAKRERIEINALLHAHYVPSHNHDHDEILGKLTRYCGKSVYNYTEGETDPLKWDFYNSFYFAYTVVSTIGYGNLAPTNMLGRILMIFYGVVGIPINGILLTQLGEFFGRAFVKAHQKYKSYKLGRNDYHQHQHRPHHRPKKFTTFETGKVGLAAQIFAYLTPGFVMFIFFPAFLFSHYEGWKYDEAVYYAFVTLTTIGFGDYVAGQDNSKGSGVLFVLYKIFLICWISFGLGYIFMIMTFIAQGMRSKKITRIEHKLAANLKHTQSKIWNEFNKEMNYLRRVFNELQLSKVKRVYVDECNHQLPPTKLPRSSSFPDLRDLSYGTKGGVGGRNDDDGIVRHGPPRRRANSEVVATEDQIARVVSETDLQRIDKTATFATHAMVQPAELLARLVNILGYIPPATEDGGDYSTQQQQQQQQQTAFVEQEEDRRRSRTENGNGKRDRSSEKESIHAQQSFGSGTTWTIGGGSGNERILRFPPRLRSRAASEIRLHETKKPDNRNVEWTWSGPIASKKIQELMKARTNDASASKDRGGGGGGGTKDATTFSKLRKALTSTSPWKHRFSTSSERKDTEFVEQRESTTTTYLNDRRDSRSSTFNSRRHYHTHTGGTEVSGSNLLEETSLADFLRALTLLHATVTNTSNSWTAAATVAVDDDRILRRTRPRRKMGTACLAPPKLPSLFTLFSSPPSVSTPRSNDDTITGQTSNEESIDDKSSNGNDRSPSTQTARDATRRNSSAFVAPTVARKPRRFSLRPVATPASPPTPPRSCSPFLSDARRTQYDEKSTFSSFESPKEPLIRTEGEPGLSSPIKLPAVNDRRRSSLLRSIQRYHHDDGGGGGGISSGRGNATVVPTTPKAVPRWKAGMLQRQIGRTNLRRRVRAFSLSDVYAEDVNDIEDGSGCCGGGGGGGKSSSKTRKSGSRGVDEEAAVFDHRSSVTYETDSAVRENRTTNREPAKKFIYHRSESERRASLSRESSSPNVRFEDETVRGSTAIDALLAPNARRTTTTKNERNARVSFDGKEEKVYAERVLVVQSSDSSFSKFQSNAERRDHLSAIAAAAAAATSSFVAVDAGSQELLTEVKVENPIASSVETSSSSSRFRKTVTDISRNEPLDLAQSNSRTKKS